MSSKNSSRFPFDHPVEVIRGQRRPDSYTIRKVLAARADYLVSRLKETGTRGERTSSDYRVEELGVIVQVQAFFGKATECACCGGEVVSIRERRVCLDCGDVTRESNSERGGVR